MIPKSGSPKEEYAVCQIMAEFGRASQQFGPFGTPYEGYAVLLERMGKLWAEIKKRELDKTLQRRRAIQIGAMTMRFVLDCCEDK